MSDRWARVAAKRCGVPRRTANVRCKASMKGVDVVGTAQINEYSEQHGFEVGSDRTLCGVLLSLHTVVRPDLKFGSASGRPLCSECAAKVA